MSDVQQELETDGCSLYRHFDALGGLLYVGISLCPLSRNYTHRGKSLWFESVTTITIERYASRAEALMAERNAIANEQPRFNGGRTPLPPRSFDGGTVKLAVYLPDEIADQLRQLADERGQSLSTLVTRLLQAALAKPAKAEETAR